MHVFVTPKYNLTTQSYVITRHCEIDYYFLIILNSFQVIKFVKEFYLRLFPLQ